MEVGEERIGQRRGGEEKRKRRLQTESAVLFNLRLKRFRFPLNLPRQLLKITFIWGILSCEIDTAESHH